MNRLPPLKTRLMFSGAGLLLAVPLVISVLLPESRETLADFPAGAFSFVAWKIRHDWSSYDEAQRESHRWAWATGALSGLALATALVILVLFFGGAWFDRLLAGEAPSGIFAAGVFAVFFPQLLGYSVAQVLWWRRRR